MKGYIQYLKRNHISNYIVDNGLDLKDNPELFDFLLSDTVKN